MKNKNNKKDVSLEGGVETLKDKEGDYTGKSITILSDIEAIQKHPGMYIGETINANHLVYEVLNNAVDEHMVNHGSEIRIDIEEDKIVIEDFARGIPIDKHSSGKLTCEIVFMKNHSGGKFEQGAYKRSGGLHGVGLVAVNALSKYTEVEICREGKTAKVKFEKGILKKTKITDNLTDKISGTKITFVPCKDTFTTTVDHDKLVQRINFLAALNPNLKIIFNGKEIQKPGGISTLADDFVKQPVVEENIVIDYSGEDCEYKVIINWGNSGPEKFASFTNSIIQSEGGAHVSGVRQGIYDFFNKSGVFERVFQGFNSRLEPGEKPYELTTSDFKSGLVIVISLSIQSPSFASQEKVYLTSYGGTPKFNIKNHIAKTVSESLLEIYNNDSNRLKNLINRIIKHLTIRYQKPEDIQLSANMFDGALSDCYTKERHLAELYITEGESAAGIVKPVIDREFQAVLSLRGKIMNIEKASEMVVFKSSKLMGIIQAIGGELKSDGHLVIEKLRYGKIIILTDADDDGEHIVSLLLALFYKIGRGIILTDRLYLAVPPLYKIQVNNYNSYYNSIDELFLFFINSLKLNFVPKINEIFEKNSNKGNSLLNEYENFFEMNRNCFKDKRMAEQDYGEHQSSVDKVKIYLIKIFKYMYEKGISNNWNKYIISIFDYYSSGSKETIKEYLVNRFIEHGAESVEIFENDREEVVVSDYINLNKYVVTQSHIDQISEEIKNGIFCGFTHEDHIAMYNLLISGVSPNNFKIATADNQLFTYMYDFINEIQNKIVIQRFKGLGEMNQDQIYDTVINTSNRVLKKVTINDQIKAYDMYNKLMGKDIVGRKKIINEFLSIGKEESPEDDKIAVEEDLN